MAFLRKNRDWKCMVKWELLDEHEKTWKTNGLADLSYKVLKTESLDDKNKSSKITVDVKLNGNHWGNDKAGIDYQGGWDFFSVLLWFDLTWPDKTSTTHHLQSNVVKKWSEGSSILISLYSYFFPVHNFVSPVIVVLVVQDWTKKINSQKWRVKLLHPTAWTTSKSVALGVVRTTMTTCISLFLFQPQHHT